MQPLPLNAGVAAEVAFHDFLEDGQAGRAGDGISLKSMAFDKSRILGNRSPEDIGNRFSAYHGRERRIAARQSFRDAENVGGDPKGLGREHPARASDPR